MTSEPLRFAVELRESAGPDPITETVRETGQSHDRRVSHRAYESVLARTNLVVSVVLANRRLSVVTRSVALVRRRSRERAEIYGSMMTIVRASSFRVTGETNLLSATTKRERACNRSRLILDLHGSFHI